MSNFSLQTVNKDQCIHELFELQVERASLMASLLTPDAIAAVFEDKQLTYHELNCRANQLAHHLQSLGVGPEVLVGICLERSLEMLIGLLGILKAGGAYVPLDPAFPLERLAFVLEDAQVSILLTQKHLVESLPKNQARVICLDTEWELIAQQNKENPTSEVTADNLAYAIYTSGSTGKPKGVQILHRAVVNFLNSIRLSPGLTEEDILLAVTTITFDIAALELFLPLAVGARVVIASREVASDGLQLSSTLLTSGATVMQATPASWQILLRAGWQGSKQLKILCGGEALPHELANQLLKKCASLWNLYGPTETTIWSTVSKVDCGNGSMCIGRPIANTELYLLNEQMQTVLVGVPGELYIGGAGLARGYLNRPELTAERFIPNPFSNELDARLYKTGDLARYLPDGNIEYIGRIDHQVKIRGFRIELGEIEAALCQHPNVQDGVVIAREDIPGDKRLVGYIVSKLIPDRVPYQSSASAELDGRCALDLTTQDISLSGVCLVGVPTTWKQGQNVCVRLLLPGVVSEARWLEGKVAWCEGKRAGIQLVLTPTEQTLLTQSFEYLLEQQGFLKMLQRTIVGNLRSFLQQKLPNYMVPSSFVFLNALPLTPNGKIDRKALPAPDRIRHDLEEDFAAPRTPIEEELAGIWSEVLGLEQIGIQDNFLELGGHSLLATQIISRLRDIYQVELSVRQLFDRPTVAGLAESIETICAENQGLQAPLIQPVGRDFASANSYSSRNLPLSFAQERLWFLDQLMPENPFYNVIEAVRLAGSLNAIALEQSLNEIIKRHETLRTIFTTVSGQPVQVIQDFYNFKLSVVNLQGVPKTEREAHVRQLATKEAQQLFDLTKGPLLRFTLLQLDEQEYILLLNLHHILCDDWSLGVLFEELTALYQAFSTGKPSPLPELGIQYADFAVWQRQWLEEVQPKQLAYWQQQLADLPILQLPTDRPRPAVPTYRGALQSVVLPKTLTAALKALSQQEGVTLYMTLLAAFQTLLFRYTSSEDIPVGSAIANRHQPNVQKLIGFFANTVVLRTDLSGSPSFLMLLARVREVALAAYAYQDLPFEKLVAQLQPERDLSRQPLFQVVFALQNVAPLTGLKLPGLETTSVQIDNGTAKFDLFLQLSDTPEGLTGWIEYSADLFDAATISRMAGHFQTLLEGIVADPEQRISDLPLLTETERHQLLVEWNDTQADYPLNACIHQLFEAQVEQTPDAVAVVFEQEQLTYRELNCRANQLAHHLKTLGVEPDVLVGICIERSLEMIVGMLGILKAGGAYVPLDPAYPPERLAFMLEDARVPVLLTQERLVKSLPPHQARVIHLDTDWEATIARQSQENPIDEVKSDNLAYAIYTSGSTGKPKGVLVEHQGLCNLATAQQKLFDVQPDSRVLQFASLNFDASIWEIVMSLVAGATLCLAMRDSLMPGPSLIQLLREQAISIATLPPSVLAVLPAEELSALRTIIVAGEACSPDIVAKWAPGRRFFNAYGPTEATVCATIAEFSDCNKKPPIGRPIANTRCLILDTQLQPVPIGVPGEIYISSVGLARGYLNQPELSVKKFIPNPFIKELDVSVAGSDRIRRLYKTGDLARYLPDGNIEFLGRIDHQVKIRGFRIELGEIQSVLSQHPAVQTAAVIDREDVPGQKRLVAYLVQKLQADKVLDELPDLDSEYVSQWRSLYEETYSQTATHQDATFNIIGWNSSYTGLPIPEAEMREWVDYTVNRILSLQPSRVLEIGCGTGLLLSRIAPHCIQYWGMDFSQEAIEYLEQLKRHKPELAQVTLLQRTADNFEGIEPDTFDTVILNSVMQYFPNIDYLLQVLKNAVNAVRCGGFIFLGDIRSLPLLEAYHASVELHQAPDSLTRSQFFGHIQQRIAQEEELVIDPAFFIALKQHLPKIADVQIQLKQGRYHNELTRFRYDVILHVGTEVPPAVDIPWLDWHQQNLTLPALRKAIAQTQPEIIGVRGVPNARLLAEIHTLEWLSSSDRPDTVGELRSEKLHNLQDAGVDPEVLWSLSHDLPYSIDITWSQFGANGCYDVVFKHHTKAATVVSAFKDTVPLKPWHCYGNNPLQGKLAQNLIPQIRRFLQDKLPDYMIPSAFVLLDALPVTPNGKLDRSALPAPERTRVKVEEDFVASRTPLEEQLVSLWTKVLGIENIGINENFFELGGNSLLAAQLIAYMRATFRVELPVRCLFEKPTVEGLAQIIQTIHKEGISAIATAIDFSAEAVLAPEIFPQGTSTDDVSEPHHIFLTGATGFVGAFLLHELLEQTQAKIYCLVRSPNESEGAKRLQKILEKYLLWNPSQSSRIIPILGDLDQPLLGLSVEQFEKLALQLDTIYHNGAQVNFSKSYSTIKAANVGGTQEVLRLACMGKTKPVHYISTCGIYGPIGYFTGLKVIKEEEDIAIAKDYLYMDFGYIQSKWVAEKLVDIAKSRELPVSIYRLGFVMGDTKTGVTNTTDYISRMIKGCIQMGSFPDLVEQKQEFVPVDFVSKAIVHLSSQKESLGKAFHLVPLPGQNIDLIQFFDQVSSYGYQLKKIPYTQWKNELIEQTAQSQDNALYPLVPIIAEQVYQDSLSILQLYQNTPDYRCKNTLDGLAGTSIVCPPMDDKLIETYFSYFISSGFLEPPQSSNHLKTSMTTGAI